MNDLTGLEVAIIGMSARFPGAPNIDIFWQNLRDGVESISFFSDEEVTPSVLDPIQPGDLNHVKAGGMLEDVESFDAEFFGLSPKEAQVTDPQHRLFLECAWEALENAGYNPETYKGDVGVYASAGANTYLLNYLYANLQFLRDVSGLQVMIGNDKDYLATRVSYKLNLQGPSMTVQSACSSSLVAVHVAYQALLNGECDMALAGGVSISVPQKTGYLYQEGGVVSPDGHCRAFDAQAKGTVKGNGVGVIVLKRLVDALKDRDSIFAVIKSSAVNNDGCSKIGYTAPSVDAQAKVIRAAQALAEVEAHTITYIEAHGTATVMGDPIELAALTQAFSARTNAKGFCAIGSVKTNIGHLDAAAGIAGVIKAVLALTHGLIPPSLHYAQANPNIDFESSPFYVNATLSEWRRGETARRAGVSSFGIGGTNAHIILEEAPTVDSTETSHSPQLLVLSARTQSALETVTTRLIQHLKLQPDLDLDDVAYTSQVGRKAFKHRRTLVCHTVEDALMALETHSSTRVFTAVHDSPTRPTAFLFPGQGTQYIRMMAGLYESEPSFRGHVNHCFELLKPHLCIDLCDVLYPASGDEVAASQQLDQTSLAQPALFTVEYALAQLWREWGVEPQAMIGHSIGEYVAACLAGVFTLDEALRLVAVRARLMQQLPTGTMLAVPLPEEEVRSLLGNHLSLAAINRRSLCVVSGPPDAVDQLDRELGERGLACHRLHTSHAFHSSMVEPVLEPFIEVIRKVNLRIPAIPYLSNVTGTWITDVDATDPLYWARHLRNTVRFLDGITELMKSRDWILLEVGPGQTLTTSVKQQVHGTGSMALSSLSHSEAQEPDVPYILNTAGHLWSAGVELDWSRFSSGRRCRRITLPTYPFQRQRYWVEPQMPQTFASVLPSTPTSGSAVANIGARDSQHPSQRTHRRPLTETSYVEPKEPIEQLIACLWEEALSIDRIGTHDDFFALGGDSIVSLQVTACASQVGLRLTPSQILRCPTVAELAAVADLLSAHDTRETSAQLAPTNEQYSQLPVIVPASDQRYEPFPLTDVQQAYWLGRGEAFQLGNVASHVYQEYESDVLELQKLEAALNSLIDRHEALRMVTTLDGRQQILEHVPPYRIEVLDLRGQSPEDVEAQLYALRQRMSHQVLPSDRWPLFEVRATLLEKGGIRLHLSVDILFTDAWSLVLAGRELLKRYNDPTCSFPEFQLSFRDYVLTQAELRNSQLYRRSQEYWLDRLASLPAAPALPLAKQPGAILKPRFVRRTARLEPETWGQLKARAGRAGLTSSMILCAAFAEVLAMWSKSPHFCINLPLFNRLSLHPQVNEILGDFTSVLLLEVNNAGKESFEVRAQRIQSQLWKDLEYRSFSGVEVMRELARTEPLRAAMPIVFTSLILPDAQSGNSDTEASLGEEIFSVSQTPQVWLDHQVSEDAGGLVFNWDAIEDLFPSNLLQEMFDAYSRLLYRLAEDEQTWHLTHRCPLLLPSSQTLEPTPINAANSVVSAELLHTLFTMQASQHPLHPAVIASSRILTYGELSRCSNQIANRLRSIDVQPGNLVAIVMEKGWEQVAATLGVLHAGAAYVPIDPALPRERLWSLLADAKVKVVLTQPWLEENLVWPETIVRIRVSDVDLKGIDEQPLEVRQQPDDLAYVIYTSGTTGLPKGVMIDHRGAVNTILDINQRFAVGHGDRVLALSSLSFDLSVYDVFGTLAAGATIVMPEASAARDPAYWAELITCEHVTIWNSVPQLMELLAQYAERRALPPFNSLRLVLMSGDWIPVGLPKRVEALGDDVRVISLGGATEASIWSILYPIDEINPAWKSIPYGKPMSNQSVYVLDENLDPRPAWVAGELYIGGIGLAKGYWQNEEETRARFIEHPLNEERLYRTGDFGRLLPDGNIEFLGREDSQVKVHGYRIELSEIEAVLAQHEVVQTAVVTAISGQDGNKRLVAYIVSSAASLISVGELRDFSRARLPDYMVPSAFVLLNELPLTPNGKVDRRALPAPERSMQAPQLALARTGTEMRLAEMWAQALEIDQVGIEDSLFELGGDSLSATKLVLQIRDLFQIDLPLRAIFETPTIAGLAKSIDMACSTVQTLPTQPVRPVLRSRYIPLSSGQRRLWFLDRLDPGNTTYNYQEAVRITGSLDIPTLERSLNEVVQRHEVLRTTFAEVEGDVIQIIAPIQLFSIALTDLSQLTEEEQEAEVQRVISAEVQFSFELTQGPLLRLRLLGLRPDTHVLVVTMHHIITDAWSMAVFIKEVSALYDAYSRGMPSPLDDLPVQYADFAVWENEELQSTTLQKQLAYWKNQLGGALPVLALPSDHPNATAQTNNGARCSFVVSSELTAGLKELCQCQNVTLFMTLLTAWQMLLHYYSGQEDILVGSPTANRDQQETEGLIGFFVNTLVFRTRLSGNPSFVDLLQQVREIALEAYTHQRLPFDRLVEEIWLERKEADRKPLFRVWFVLQNVPMPPLKLADLVMTPLEANSLMAVHDLKLSVVEHSEGLHCALDYRTHLFEPATITRMAALFDRLLHSVVAFPHSKLSKLVKILSETERMLKDIEEREQREQQAQKLRVARRQVTRLTTR